MTSNYVKLLLISIAALCRENSIEYIISVLFYVFLSLNNLINHRLFTLHVPENHQLFRIFDQEIIKFADKDFYILVANQILAVIETVPIQFRFEVSDESSQEEKHQLMTNCTILIGQLEQRYKQLKATRRVGYIDLDTDDSTAGGSAASGGSAVKSR